MKKISKLFLLLSIVICGCFVFTSCEEKTPTPTEITEITDPKEALKATIIKDVVVDYDGQPHNISVENLPEGATVTYSRNDLIEPGKYKVNAKMEYNGVKLTRSAYLTINKLKSIIDVNDTYSYYLYDNNDLPYLDILNNDEQKLIFTYYNGNMPVEETQISIPGTYRCEVYAPESEHYLASDIKEFTITTYTTTLNIKYDDSYLTYDGNNHELLITGTLPEGYTVSYENNSGSEIGNYFATATIKNSSGSVVETHRATLTIDYAHNEEFETYLDEFLVEYFEGDQLSVNIFFENPEDFGLTHYEPKWYTYSTEDDDYTNEDAIAEFKAYLDELHAFDSSKLNQRQKTAYRKIDEFLSYYYDYYQIEDADYQQIIYVDQFGGYVADFGTYMEAYTLRSEKEVQDIIDYLNSTLEAFPSYVEFVKDKAEKGYALSDYTIYEMRNYLDDLLTEHNPEKGTYYYLNDVLHAKIDAVEFLSNDQKASYKNDITDAICNSFIPGVKALYDGLKDCTGNLESENEGYWAIYENGKTLYEMDMKDLLGLNNFDMTKFISEIDKELKLHSNSESKMINDLISKYAITTQEELDELLASVKIFDGTPEEMLVFLKEFAKTIVPELSYTPDITVKEMDEASAKVSNAVAYYMKSAVDNFDKEFITLNPIKLGDSNDVLGTLAHEGYPGHLYAYCFSKQLDLHELSKIMTSTAHAEGWATYVELKLYEYAYRTASTEKDKEIINYLITSHKAAYLLETRIDLGIHAEGWKIKEIGEFLTKLGYSDSYASDLFYQMIEMPTTYAAYGYGKYYFMKLHNEAKRILGKFYNEIEFNAKLLSKGWTKLGELEDTYNDYMIKACHKYGITQSE